MLDRRFRRLGVVVLSLVSIGSAVPRVCQAQAFNWLLPAGGETWTAGTSHSLAWSGGPPNVLNVSLIQVTPFQNAGTIAFNIPYTLGTLWSIPANLPPGAYQVYIEDLGATQFAYSLPFQVVAPPPCAPGCTRVSIGPTMYGYSPGTSCHSTLAGAIGLANSYISAQVAGGCPAGWFVATGSTAIDLTQSPYPSCFVGQTGFFGVEATATFCCCPGPTDARRSTWGQLKSHYR